MNTSDRSEPNEGRHLLTELVAAIEDAIIVVGAAGEIVSFNAGATAVFGYDPVEVLGKDLSILLPEGARAGHHAHLAGFAAEGMATRRMGQRGEIQGRRKDGSTFPAEASIVTLEEGGRRYFAAILRDVSDRRAKMHELAAQERKFNMLFNSSNQFCALLDSQGSVIELNSTWLDFAGKALTDIRGGQFADLPFWGDEADQHQKVAAAVGDSVRGNYRGLSVELVGADGISKTILLSLRPVTIDGVTDYVIVNGADVTELTQANDALRLTSRRLRRAQKIATMGYWDWNIAGNSLYWSDDVYVIFGIPQTAFGADYEAFLACIHPEDLTYVQDSVDAALRGEMEYSIDHRIILPSGEVRYVHEQAEVIFDDARRPLRMDGIVQDVTERKKQELALRVAIQQSEAASRAKSSFLANMSHELRTPLNAIIGFSEVLQGQGQYGTKLSPDKIAEYAGHILKSGQHLLSIITDILDLAKIESGKITLNEGDHDIYALVRRSLNFVREQAGRKGLTLMVEVPEVSCLMRVDERLIVQALINLMVNAIKFTPAPGSVSVRAWLGADGQLHICVADTGIGISSSDLLRVMQPFEQVAGSLSREHDGAGLGLSLVHQFVSLHGGTFALESELGHGIRANVILPASRILSDKIVPLHPKTNGATR